MTDKEKLHQILSSLWKNDDSVGKTYYNQALQDVQTAIDLQEDFVSKDLEQTIDTYLATYFSGEKEKQEWPFLKKMTIHFTEWQKHKDESYTKSMYKVGINTGKELMKQQMIAKAISAQCFGFQGAALFSFKLPADNYLVGSKVKVIVIKEV